MKKKMTKEQKAKLTKICRSNDKQGFIDFWMASGYRGQGLKPTITPDEKAALIVGLGDIWDAEKRFEVFMEEACAKTKNYKMV